MDWQQKPSNPLQDLIAACVQAIQPEGPQGPIVYTRNQVRRIRDLALRDGDTKLARQAQSLLHRPVATACAHGRLRPGRLCAVCQVVGKR